MSTFRRKHSAQFKAKVALLAYKGDQTASELMSHYKVSSGQLRICPAIKSRYRWFLAPSAALQKRLHSGAMRVFLCLADNAKPVALFGILLRDKS